MICEYCKVEIKPKNENEIIGLGFIDGDTNQIVCWKCRDRHYLEKAKTKYADLYTEFPLIVNKNSASLDHLRSEKIK